ncbi:hypothetical protein AGR4C_pb20144 [Agrobacterium tumefaciens str. Kerr 14]|uniref:Uncharacterized protein n=1 Tax=Agrobacterium tumefaciens str. Kerr 14 TaxID=1183424 RepID=A0A1S7SE14_AGRTU|nr:hypothetical protein [Agrobacterium tumefaciens]CUX67467.1 hypothetical protein AGR4C_pb20144 [Agrobacterium tumefaciens str. Kerr 14]
MVKANLEVSGTTATINLPAVSKTKILGRRISFVFIIFYPNGCHVWEDKIMGLNEPKKRSGVLIAGGGPVGLFLAADLGARGVP